MTTSRHEEQPNFDDIIGTSDDERNVVVAGEPEPTFLDNDGPLDIPLFVTTTNARELFGLRPGETVAQAVSRMASEG